MTRSSIFHQPKATDPPYIHRTRLEDYVRRADRSEERTVCVFCGATIGCGVTRLFREGWQNEISDTQRRELVAPVDLVHPETGQSPQVMADIAFKLIEEADALGYDGKKHFRDFSAAFLVFMIKLHGGRRTDFSDIIDWPETRREKRSKTVVKFGIRFATMGIADAFDLAGAIMGESSEGFAEEVSRYILDFVDGEVTGRSIGLVEEKLSEKLLSGSFNSAREHGVDDSVTATVLCEQLFEEGLINFLAGFREAKEQLGALILIDHVDACLQPDGPEPDKSDFERWSTWVTARDLSEVSEKSVGKVMVVLQDPDVSDTKLRAAFGLRGKRLPLTADMEAVRVDCYPVEDLKGSRVKQMLERPPEGKEDVAAQVLEILHTEGMLVDGAKVSPAVLASLWRKAVGEI